MSECKITLAIAPYISKSFDKIEYICFLSVLLTQNNILKEYISGLGMLTHVFSASAFREEINRLISEDSR